MNESTEAGTEMASSLHVELDVAFLDSIVGGADACDPTYYTLTGDCTPQDTLARIVG